jgi:hypothetical protein
MGSQFLSIVPERTGFAMFTPVRGFHKSTEVHCPNARGDIGKSLGAATRRDRVSGSAGRIKRAP